MNLKVSLSAKFRAFGITFATVSHSWTIPLKFPNILPAETLVNFNDAGVNLVISIEPAPGAPTVTLP